jgi:hypothetical protein
VTRLTQTDSADIDLDAIACRLGPAVRDFSKARKT